MYYCEMADVVKSWFQTEAIQLTTMRFRYGVEVDIHGSGVKDVHRITFAFTKAFDEVALIRGVQGGIRCFILVDLTARSIP